MIHKEPTEMREESSAPLTAQERPDPACLLPSCDLSLSQGGHLITPGADLNE